MFFPVGILTFMSRKNVMLSALEHEKSFITSGPGITLMHHLSVIKMISSLKSKHLHCSYRTDILMTDPRFLWVE